MGYMAVKYCMGYIIQEAPAPTVEVLYKYGCNSNSVEIAPHALSDGTNGAGI